MAEKNSLDNLTNKQRSAFWLSEFQGSLQEGFSAIWKEGQEGKELSVHAPNNSVLSLTVNLYHNASKLGTVPSVGGIDGQRLGYETPGIDFRHTTRMQYHPPVPETPDYLGKPSKIDVKGVTGTTLLATSVIASYLRATDEENKWNKKTWNEEFRTDVSNINEMNLTQGARVNKESPYGAQLRQRGLVNVQLDFGQDKQGRPYRFEEKNMYKALYGTIVGERIPTYNTPEQHQFFKGLYDEHVLPKEDYLQPTRGDIDTQRNADGTVSRKFTMYEGIKPNIKSYVEGGSSLAYPMRRVTNEQGWSSFQRWTPQQITEANPLPQYATPNVYGQHGQLEASERRTWLFADTTLSGSSYLFRNEKERRDPEGYGRDNATLRVNLPGNIVNAKSLKDGITFNAPTGNVTQFEFGSRQVSLGQMSVGGQNIDLNMTKGQDAFQPTGSSFLALPRYMHKDTGEWLQHGDEGAISTVPLARSLRKLHPDMHIRTARGIMAPVMGLEGSVTTSVRNRGEGQKGLFQSTGATNFVMDPETGKLRYIDNFGGEMKAAAVNLQIVGAMTNKQQRNLFEDWGSRFNKGTKNYEASQAMIAEMDRQFKNVTNTTATPLNMEKLAEIYRNRGGDKDFTGGARELATKVMKEQIYDNAQNQEVNRSNIKRTGFGWYDNMRIDLGPTSQSHYDMTKSEFMRAYEDEGWTTRDAEKEFKKKFIYGAKKAGETPIMEQMVSGFVGSIMTPMISDNASSASGSSHTFQEAVLNTDETAAIKLGIHPSQDSNMAPDRQRAASMLRYATLQKARQEDPDYQIPEERPITDDEAGLIRELDTKMEGKEYADKVSDILGMDKSDYKTVPSFRGGIVPNPNTIRDEQFEKLEGGDLGGLASTYRASVSRHAGDQQYRDQPNADATGMIPADRSMYLKTIQSTAGLVKSVRGVDIASGINARMVPNAALPTNAMSADAGLIKEAAKRLGEGNYKKFKAARRFLTNEVVPALAQRYPGMTRGFQSLNAMVNIPRNAFYRTLGDYGKGMKRDEAGGYTSGALVGRELAEKQLGDDDGDQMYAALMVGWKEGGAKGAFEAFGKNLVEGSTHALKAIAQGISKSPTLGVANEFNAYVKAIKDMAKGENPLVRASNKQVTMEYGDAFDQFLNIKSPGAVIGKEYGAGQTFNVAHEQRVGKTTSKLDYEMAYVSGLDMPDRGVSPLGAMVSGANIGNVDRNNPIEGRDWLGYATTRAGNPDDPDGWKITNRMQENSGDERNDISGNGIQTFFTQAVRDAADNKQGMWLQTSQTLAAMTTSTDAEATKVQALLDKEAPDKWGSILANRVTAMYKDPKLTKEQVNAQVLNTDLMTGLIGRAIGKQKDKGESGIIRQLAMAGSDTALGQRMLINRWRAVGSQEQMVERKAEYVDEANFPSARDLDNAVQPGVVSAGQRFLKQIGNVARPFTDAVDDQKIARSESLNAQARAGNVQAQRELDRIPGSGDRRWSNKYEETHAEGEFDITASQTFDPKDAKSKYPLAIYNRLQNQGLLPNSTEAAFGTQVHGMLSENRKAKGLLSEQKVSGVIGGRKVGATIDALDVSYKDGRMQVGIIDYKSNVSNANPEQLAVGLELLRQTEFQNMSPEMQKIVTQHTGIRGKTAKPFAEADLSYAMFAGPNEGMLKNVRETVKRGGTPSEEDTNALLASYDSGSQLRDVTDQVSALSGNLEPVIEAGIAIKAQAAEAVNLNMAAVQAIPLADRNRMTSFADNVGANGIAGQIATGVLGTGDQRRIPKASTGGTPPTIPPDNGDRGGGNRKEGGGGDPRRENPTPIWGSNATDANGNFIPGIKPEGWLGAVNINGREGGGGGTQSAQKQGGRDQKWGGPATISQAQDALNDYANRMSGSTTGEGSIEERYLKMRDEVKAAIGKDIGPGGVREALREMMDNPQQRSKAMEIKTRNSDLLKQASELDKSRKKAFAMSKSAGIYDSDKEEYANSLGILKAGGSNQELSVAIDDLQQTYQGFDPKQKDVNAPIRQQMEELGRSPEFLNLQAEMKDNRVIGNGRLEGEAYKQGLGAILQDPSKRALLAQVESLSKGKGVRKSGVMTTEQEQILEAAEAGKNLFGTDALKPDKPNAKMDLAMDPETVRKQVAAGAQIADLTKQIEKLGEASSGTAKQERKALEVKRESLELDLRIDVARARAVGYRKQADAVRTGSLAGTDEGLEQEAMYTQKADQQDAIADRAEASKESKFSLASAGRKLFGGWGLMYARSIMGMATQGIGWGAEQNTKMREEMGQAQYQEGGWAQQTQNQDRQIANMQAVNGQNMNALKGIQMFGAQHRGLATGAQLAVTGVTSAVYADFIMKSIGASDAMKGQTLNFSNLFGMGAKASGPGATSAAQAATDQAMARALGQNPDDVLQGAIRGGTQGRLLATQAGISGENIVAGAKSAQLSTDKLGYDITRYADGTGKNIIKQAGITSGGGLTKAFAGMAPMSAGLAATGVIMGGAIVAAIAGDAYGRAQDPEGLGLRVGRGGDFIDKLAMGGLNVNPFNKTDVDTANKYAAMSKYIAGGGTTANGGGIGGYNVTSIGSAIMPGGKGYMSTVLNPEYTESDWARGFGEDILKRNPNLTPQIAGFMGAQQQRFGWDLRKFDLKKSDNFFGAYANDLAMGGEAAKLGGAIANTSGGGVAYAKGTVSWATPTQDTWGDSIGVLGMAKLSLDNKMGFGMIRNPDGTQTDPKTGTTYDDSGRPLIKGDPNKVSTGTREQRNAGWIAAEKAAYDQDKTKGMGPDETARLESALGTISGLSPRAMKAYGIRDDTKEGWLSSAGKLAETMGSWDDVQKAGFSNLAAQVGSLSSGQMKKYGIEWTSPEAYGSMTEEARKQLDYQALSAVGAQSRLDTMVTGQAENARFFGNNALGDQVASQMAGMTGFQATRYNRLLSGDPTMMTAQATQYGTNLGQMNIPTISGGQFNAAFLGQMGQTDIGMNGQMTGMNWGQTSFQSNSMFGNMSAEKNMQNMLGADYKTNPMFAGAQDVIKAGVEGVDLGYTFKTATGETSKIGGIEGMQFKMQQQQDAFTMANLNRQEKMMALDESYTKSSWQFQDKGRALSNQYQEWQFGFQQRGLDRQQSQFNENMGMQLAQTNMQRGNTREDWGYNANVRSLQWTWKTEDFEENNRFLTGRQRKISERGMDRDTTMHNMEEGQIAKGISRQQQAWALEDKRFEIQRKQFGENMKAQQEQLDRSRQYFEENKHLQDQQIKAEREHYKQNLALQKEATAAQIAYNKTQMDNQRAMAALALSMKSNQATANLMVDGWQTLTAALIANSIAVQANIRAYQPAGGNNPSSQNNTWTSSGGEHPGGGGEALGGPIRAGQRYRVGELGPEDFISDVDGKIIPNHRRGSNNSNFAEDAAETAFIPLAKRNSQGSGMQQINIFIGNDKIDQYIVRAIQGELA